MVQLQVNLVDAGGEHREGLPVSLMQWPVVDGLGFVEAVGGRNGNEISFVCIVEYLAFAMDGDAGLVDLFAVCYICDFELALLNAGEFDPPFGGVGSGWGFRSFCHCEYICE